MIKYDVPLSLGENNNLSKLVTRIRKNSIILEFGPSTGRLTKYLKEQLNCKVYGVEIDELALRASKQFMIDSLCDDIETYRWMDRFKGIKFDFVIFADVLEHLRNPHKVIETVRGVLKEDGEVLVSIPNIAHNSVLIELMQNRFDYNATGLLDNTHIHFFTADTCREMFEQKGYHIAYSNGTTAEPYNTELKNTFNDFPNSIADFFNTRDYGNLYQIVYAFRLVPCNYDNQLKLCKQRVYYAKVFLDDGNGFHEDNILYKEINIDQYVQNIEITKADLHENTRAIGIIPLDNFIGKCSEFNVFKNNKPYNYEVELKRIRYENMNLFDQEKIMINTEGANSIKVQYQLKIGTREEYALGLYHTLKSEKISIKKIVNKKILGKQKKMTVAIVNVNSQKVGYKSHACEFTYFEDFPEFITTTYVCVRFNDSLIQKNYFEEAMQLQSKCGYDLIYSDCYDAKDNLICKTDFSYEYLLQKAQENDVLFMTSIVYNNCQKSLKRNLSYSSYDYMLQLMKEPISVGHLCVPFYHVNSSKVVLNENSLKLIQENATLLYDRLFNNIEKIDDQHCVVRYKMEKQPKVAIIIPMKDNWEMSDACVNSILDKTTYDNYEILILNNNSEREETIQWLNQIKNNKVRVLDADFDFNWSRLNNYGIAHTDADVFIFLNNDTLLISPDWIERLVEDTIRVDTGVVGALLLYEDNTIQHAGVVVGMNEFADHIYKQEALTYCNDIFPSPLDKRNVLSVTGACMAVSRKTVEEIGLFNEDFIICGSDVELCIRAYKKGLKNIYDPYVKLYHLESKSRDSYIPPIDFEMSIKYYAPFREEGDPYFNQNLSLKDTTPKKRGK